MDFIEKIREKEERRKEKLDWLLKKKKDNKEETRKEKLDCIKERKKERKLYWL